jgi:MFS family permease
LTQWTWRAIFWVNIPVALVALILIFLSKPQTVHRPARMDYKGLVLIAAGVALSVFGFQQSAVWGWSNPATAGSIAVGAVLLVVFYFAEIGTASPLIEVSIFRGITQTVRNYAASLGGVCRPVCGGTAGCAGGRW